MGKKGVGLKSAVMDPPNDIGRPTGSTGPLRMDFPEALRALIARYRRITRLAWGNPNVYLDIHGGYLVLHKADGTMPQLLVSEGDMFADDWVVVESNENN